MSSKDRSKRLYRIFASKELAIILFGVICLASLPGTFTGKKGFYVSPLFIALLGLLGLHLLVCTVQRLKTISKPVLIIHAGVLVTLIGAAVTSTGFVATVNIYEGGTVDTAYRWDWEEDLPLGLDLTVEKIHVEYYPIPVKVGVLKGQEKAGLFTLKTGESFDIADYRVRVDAMDSQSESLRLSVFNHGHFIGLTETPGMGELPSGFEYSFVLVAYKNPVPKRVWVDLMLSRGPEIIAEGTSEVNSPFEWQGLRFSHTQVERDPYGIPYAGIQITKDPGRRVVYAGFVVILAGVVLWMRRKLYGYR